MPNPEMKTLTVGNNTFDIRDDTKLPLAGGTMTGAIAMGANKITGLAAGSSNTDAVNKKQLDDAIAGIGTVFNIKGDVATVADLPSTGNSIGDVYYVQSVSAGYVWLQTTAHPTGYWEELGETIDLSGYIAKPSSPTAGDNLSFDGNDWIAKPPIEEVTSSTAGSVTQALDAGKIYHFTGALTALTITLNAASGLAQYHFDFDCGSTAPTVTIPATVTMPDSNSFDASKHYEVDILNNYGAVLSWANS